MKKKGKITAGILLAFSMAIVLAAPVSAEEPEEEDQEIVIDNEDAYAEISEDSTDNDPTENDTTENDPSIPATGISVNETSITMHVVGQTVQLTATVIPEDATEKDISWESDAKSVATVDENGKVTAVAGGTAHITASVTSDEGTFTAACTVKVSLYNGFNKDPDSDDWYYYKNGKVDTVTDVMQGTVNEKSGWWNVIKGKVTKGEDVAQNSNGWWYINSDGKVDFSYKGFAKNKYGWWYIEGGKVIFSKNSVIQDIKKKIDGSSGWWYVTGGQVKTGYTGVADYSNAYGWWYVKNGKVDFSANTVAQNKYGWWYVTGGKVQFGYTGVGNYSNAYGWWYIKNGKVDFSANTVAQNKYGWWYVTGGKVQFGYTGVSNYGNANGWWYIKDGKVDFSVKTVAQNKYGWWYVINGKVMFVYTGVVNYTNAYGWWYVKDGKVDFSYTGDGANRYGVWYVKNGKVDFSFTGTFTSSGVRYTAKNGRVTSSSSGSEGYSLTSSQLSRTKSNKGIWINDHTFTQDEYYALVKKFMSSDPYATKRGYSMTGSNFVFDKNPGSRWDCSSMTDYFLSRYICYYASKYYDASKSNPSASASKLQQTALNAIPPSSTSSFYKEITSNSLRYYLPETSTYNGYEGAVASAETLTLTQMQYWGNPVYTADTYKQISDTNPGKLQVGDLLFFGSAPGTNGQTYGSVTHVAIYLGEYYGKGNGYYMLENVGYPPRKVYEYEGSGTVKGVQISYFETEIGSESHVLWHAARVINVAN